MKQTIVSQDGYHAKKIEAFTALEVQDFKALEELSFSDSKVRRIFNLLEL